MIVQGDGMELRALAGGDVGFWPFPKKPPTKIQQMAAEIAKIPAYAHQIAAYRRTVAVLARSGNAHPDQVKRARDELNRAQNKLSQANNAALAAWGKAFAAGKVPTDRPPKVSVEMNDGELAGIFEWVAIGVGVAIIIAAFVISAPLIAAIGALVVALAVVSQIIQQMQKVGQPQPIKLPSGEVVIPANPVVATSRNVMVALLIVGGLMLLSKSRSRR